ncbi:hypothetical protein BJ170DRAFT_628064 [Xylariales sp. AK1849]|nr:hypothetical protein BJ170DRAFT_628064 [Xylariales sp. AK1849]
MSLIQGQQGSLSDRDMMPRPSIADAISIYTSETPHRPMSAGSQDAEANFRFVSINISGSLRPSESDQRLARGHAVRQSLKDKRKLLQEDRGNFRHITYKGLRGSTKQRRRPRLNLECEVVENPINRLGEGQLDPFDALPVRSSRLQFFMSQSSSRQAVEPVFSLTGNLPFQNFYTIFRSGLDESSLSNALLMALAFAANGWTMNVECLAHKNRSIQAVNEKMATIREATKPSTIGAILLLVGIEYRMGVRANVEIHMRGIRQILRLCQSDKIFLPDGIKRAVFWQDLNAALMTGSERLFDHCTFPELNWQRDPLLSLPVAPVGFQQRAGIMGENLMSIIEDVHALQVLCDFPAQVTYEPVAMLHIDNQQAWIESRLHWCWKEAKDAVHLRQCCILATYLYTFDSYAEIWCSSMIPLHCSSQLLGLLQQETSIEAWDGHEDLLLWVFMVGAGIIPPGDIRDAYTVLLRDTFRAQLSPLVETWTRTETLLKKFLWSGKVLEQRWHSFWEEDIHSGRLSEQEVALC